MVLAIKINLFQGFPTTAYTPVQAGEVIAAAKSRRKAAGIEKWEFSEDDIKSGKLKDFFIPEDFKIAKNVSLTYPALKDIPNLHLSNIE